MTHVYILVTPYTRGNYIIIMHDIKDDFYRHTYIYVHKQIHKQ